MTAASRAQHLRRLGSAVTGSTRREMALRRSTAVLLRSGRFDRAFYEAQAGTRFRETSDAVRHYLTVGRYDDLSPHLLYDPTAHLTSSDSRHAARRSPFEAFLAAGQRAAARAHPSFDAAAHAAAHPGATRATGGAWAHFLDVVTDDTALPGRAGRAADGSAITWGALCSVLRAAARTAGEQRRVSEPDRLSDSWDTAAGRALVAQADAAGLPPPVPGEPLVSVVLPVRDRPAQVLEAIASVIAQTLQDWELLVVDDGSTDGTPDAVAVVADRDPRVRLIRAAAEGVCAARNRAAAQATGRFVAWLDSDTTWEPDFLRVAVSVMAARGLRAAHAVQEFVDAGGRQRFRAFDGDLTALEVGNFVDLNTLLVTRELLDRVGGFDPRLRRAVDYDLILRVASVVDLVLLPVLASVYRDDTTDTSRIGVRELQTWNYVVRQRRLVDFDALRQSADRRVDGRVSVLLAGRNQAGDVGRSVAAVLAEPGPATEVVVIDLASHVPQSLRTATLTLLDPQRVRVVRAAVNVNTGVGLNMALAASTGATVVLVGAGATPSGAQLHQLAARLDRGGPGEPGPVAGVAPLLVGPGGTVVTAGTAFAPGGSLPVPLLKGLLPADAERAAGAGGLLSVPAVSRDVVVTAARELLAVDGFDPLFVDGPDDVDLALRLARHTGAPFAVDTRVQVGTVTRAVHGAGAIAEQNRRLFMARWQPVLAAGLVPALGAALDVLPAAGFELLAFESVTAGPDAQVVSVEPVLRRRPDGGPSRWVVETTGLSADRAEQPRWRIDAAEFAAALRDAGQQAWVRSPGEPAAPYGTVDVVVTAVGRRPARPTPGVVNVLWLPDGVPTAGRQEAVGFDVVLGSDAATSSALVDAVVADAQRFVPFPAAVAGTPLPGVPTVLVSPLGGDTTMLGLPVDARPLVAEVDRIRGRRARGRGAGSW